MANTKVTGALIADATITATNIADGAVTAAKLTGITTTSIAEGDKLFYTDARVGTYLTSNGYDTAANIIATITDSAPATLDTLNELAAALGDDPNYATTTANLIGTKLPLAGGTLTGGLHINTTSLPQLLIQNVDGGTNAERIAIELNAGDIFKIRSLNDNNTTRVDNIITANILTGNVGIGAASPNAKLEVYGTGNTIRLDSAANQGKTILFRNVGTATAEIKTDGNLKLWAEDAGRNIYFDTSSGTKMTILSGGNVGINETSPISQLHLSRQTVWGTSENRVININNTGTGGNINVAHNMGAITWYSGNSTPTAGIQAWRNTPASGNNIELRFDTAAAGIPYERMRIDSLGRVGIGSPSVGSLVHIQKNVEDGLGPDLALYNGAYNAGSFSRIRMGRQSNRNASIKAIARTAGGRNNDIVFETKLGDGGDDSTYTEIARILYAGGITFNGDTTAANALDDYEEGTWTPTITGTTSNPSVSYVTAYTGGVYTKIGNVVHVSFEVRWSALSGGLGDVLISGLPFTRRDTTQPDGDRFILDSYNNTIPGLYLVAGTVRGTTTIGITANVSGSPTVAFTMSHLGNSNPTFLRGTVTYFV